MQPQQSPVKLHPAPGQSADWGRAFHNRRAFEKELVPFVASVFAYARAITRNAVEAEDLASESLVRALSSYESFEIGSNIKAWLFTIVRHQRASWLRKWQPGPLAEGQLESLATVGNQEHRAELRAVVKALNRISPAHRNIITGIRGNGTSYEEMARLNGCRVGTIKSRLFRADAALRSALGAEYQVQRRGRPRGLERRKTTLG
jgi:RNA polymerase sigma-70 factor (ECF subfamily)